MDLDERGATVAEPTNFFTRLRDAPPLFANVKPLIPAGGIGTKKTALIVLPALFILVTIAGIISSLSA